MVKNLVSRIISKAEEALSLTNNNHVVDIAKLDRNDMQEVLRYFNKNGKHEIKVYPSIDASSRGLDTTFYMQIRRLY